MYAARAPGLAPAGAHDGLCGARLVYWFLKAIQYETGPNSSTVCSKGWFLRIDLLHKRAAP